MLKSIVNRIWAKSSNSIEDDVYRIRSDSERFNQFLAEVDTMEYEDPELSTHMKLVKDVTERIKDVVEDYGNAVQYPQIPIERGLNKILKRLCHTSANYDFSKMITDIAGIDEDIKKIKKAESEGITQRIRETLEENNQRKLRQNINHEVEEVYIEMIDDIGKVVQMLIEPSRDNFISILGQAGSGKTTIAKKVYERADVRQHFECFAWIAREKESEDQTVLHDLVKQLQVKQLHEGASKEMSDNNSNLQILLENNRCLIVLDDVRTLHELRFLQQELGRANKSMMSKVLITTRMTGVAETDQFYSPRPWTQAESWDLLYKISKIDRPDQ